MDAVFHAFFVWCCQFILVSTLFLAAGYWCLGRSRRRQAQRSAALAISMSAVVVKEARHVAHGA